MSEELALGQRELEVGGTFEPTPEEQALLDTNNMTALALQSFVDASGKQTINAAIGGLSAKIAQATAEAEQKAEVVEGGEAAAEGAENEAAESSEEAKPEGEATGEASEASKTE